MMFKAQLQQLVGVGAFAMSALLVSSARAAVVIDDFTTTTATWPIGSGGSANEAALGDVAGGVRDTSLAVASFNVPGLDSVSASVFSSGGFSLFDYQSTAGADGAGTLKYGRTSGGADLNLDLTGESLLLDFFSFDYPADQPIVVTVTLLQAAGGGTNSVTLPSSYYSQSGPGSLLIPLLPGLVPFLNDVDGIYVALDAPQAGDFRLDRISTVAVPEPASLSLLLLPLAAATRRRRA